MLLSDQIYDLMRYINDLSDPINQESLIHAKYQKLWLSLNSDNRISRTCEFYKINVPICPAITDIDLMIRVVQDISYNLPTIPIQYVEHIASTNAIVISVDRNISQYGEEENHITYQYRTPKVSLPISIAEILLNYKKSIQYCLSLPNLVRLEVSHFDWVWYFQIADIRDGWHDSQNIPVEMMWNPLIRIPCIYDTKRPDRHKLKIQETQ